jgi:hypothetical protein
MPQQRTVGSILSIAAVAALTLATGPSGAAQGDCLSAPSGLAPQGRHWRYHLDRASQRKCWYLGAVGAKPSTSAAKSAVHSELDVGMTARPFENTPIGAMRPQPLAVAPASQAASGPSAGQYPRGVAATAQSSVAGAPTAGIGRDSGTQVDPVQARDPGVAQSATPATGAPAPRQGAATVSADTPAPGPSAAVAEETSSAAAPAEPEPPAPGPQLRSVDPGSFAMIVGALALTIGIGLAISGWLVRPRDALHHRDPVRRVDPGHGSIGMIGGALALVTGIGFAISRWLFRRRDALRHRDPATVIGDVMPFRAASTEVFRPRLASAAAVVPREDGAKVPDQPNGERQRGILVEDLEATLRSVAHALRQTAS